jgi:PIN domain nuclease of toxin-antitoxin system
LRLLLDTHALVWWLLNSPRLTPKPRALIADQENELFVSAASAWELATKVRLGKWPEAMAITASFPTVLTANQFKPLPISAAHALRAGAWLASHPDPFDRMLAAQAEMDGLALLTADAAFSGFGIETIW